MRRFTSILVLLAIAALGSGALGYLHELDHAAQDARATHQGKPHPAPHDESNCLTHAQLKAPMLGAGFVPVLVCLGVFVAFLTLLSTPVLSRRPVLQLDSRGPPSRFSFHPVV